LNESFLLTPLKITRPPPSSANVSFEFLNDESAVALAPHQPKKFLVT